MSASSKLLLRLPKALHDAVKAKALAAQISVNSLLERYIERRVAESASERVSELVREFAHKECAEHFIGLLLFGSRARGDGHDK